MLFDGIEEINGGYEGMKRNKWMKQICCLVLIGVMTCGETTSVWATSQAEKEKKEAQQKLDEANKAAKEAEANKAVTQNQVNQLNAELTALLSDIHILETDMANKELEIAQAEEDYAAAVLQESVQYSAMKKRIQYMYEQGDTEYLDVLFQVKSMADLLNKTEYMTEIYSYDRRQLDSYREAKQQVEDTKAQLSDEKAEMEVMELEYKEQQGQLESTISKKKKEVSDFDAQYAQAKKDAAAYAKTVEQKNAQIRKAQEEAARKAAEEAARKKAAEEAAKKKSTTTSGTSTSKAPSSTTKKTTAPTTTKSTGGTAEGRAVADYGLSFVGNPYVYGGTSLTNGTDCSGFTQGVYAHFGYTIPRNSAAQRSAGREVAYEDAQPGDLICYAGHVAIYIGDGQIVHASTPATGIKVSPAAYRTILSVRRIL